MCVKDSTNLPDYVVGVESVDYLDQPLLVIVLKALVVPCHVMGCHPCCDVSVTLPAVVIHLIGEINDIRHSPQNLTELI